MSVSVTSRCVTARITVGWIVAESPTPACWSRASASLREDQLRRVDLDEVRLDLIEVDGNTCFVESLGERASERVVLGEPFDVMVERVHAGGRDDPRLPHRSAEEVLLAPGAFHPLVRAGEQRSERAPEALRETERHRVEARRDLGRRDAERNRGVEEACAVQVHREPASRAAPTTLVEPTSGQTRPPELLCVSSSESETAR